MTLCPSCRRDQHAACSHGPCTCDCESNLLYAAELIRAELECSGPPDGFDDDDFDDGDDNLDD
jgi:hypothetical protein